MILLARHGQTDDNVPPLKFQGRTDTPLNDTGRAQAAELAGRVRDEGVASLYTSDLSRARETADIVGREIGLDPIVDARFSEADRGVWEGRYMHDVEAEDPERYAAWRAAGDFRFPGGESLQEQMDRVIAGLVDVTHAGSLPALVVCHGGAIRVALCHTHARGLAVFHDWDVPNVTVVRL